MMVPLSDSPSWSLPTGQGDPVSVSASCQLPAVDSKHVLHFLLHTQDRTQETFTFSGSVAQRPSSRDGPKVRTREEKLFETDWKCLGYSSPAMSLGIHSHRSTGEEPLSSVSVFPSVGSGSNTPSSLHFSDSVILTSGSSRTISFYFYQTSSLWISGTTSLCPSLSPSLSIRTSR